MEAKGKITDISVDYKTKNPKITVELQASAEECEKLKDKELTVELKRFRKKRSLDANAYAWKLINEIANVLRADKDDIYLESLKRYGQREMISVQAHVPIQGYIKYFEEIGESSTNGKLFKHYFVYKGSSEFDSREMSILIDGIVSEAKAMGIQTETPDEIAKMKSLWRNNGCGA